MPREIVTLQVGQCGNQVRRVWEKYGSCVNAWGSSGVAWRRRMPLPPDCQGWVSSSSARSLP